MRSLQFVVSKFSIAALGTLAVAFSAHADEVLVLSGGGSPATNHYSQYLQTKSLTQELRTMLPRTNVQVMFGAGNATGAEPMLADVHRIVRTSGKTRDVMEPGPIAQNVSATRANVDRYFQSPRIGTMGKNDTFFLVVSDHGMPFTFPDGRSDTTYSNNCIDLWAFDVDFTANTMRPGTPAERCFSKDDLKDHLVRNVPAKRTVYAMSQCFSGGFHMMSVDTSAKYPTADSRMCGFTAVTEDDTASGCTADVDGPDYRGYERSFTEQLTGVDVVSGARLRPARMSFAEAHEAATLEDLTKDIPLSTSDFYLWKWALAIESKNFVPRKAGLNAEDARAAVASVELGKQNVANPAYAAKEATLAKMQETFVKMYPEYETILRGRISQHRALEKKLKQDLENLDVTFGPLQAVLNAHSGEILASWSNYVASGKSKLSSSDAKLETGYFAKIESNFGPGSVDEVSLYSLSLKTISNPQLASEIVGYRANRFPYATAWAARSRNPDLVDSANQVKTVQKMIDDMDKKYSALQKRHGHVRRLLIYRQALGAWNALEKMGDTQALSELRGLIECESTKLH